ncbi:MAG: thioesterase domain-containing protein [Chloroflexota bacterium]
MGVTGELCIGGAGLARGYLNRPEWTAERFVFPPFDPRRRLYRTGDAARYLPDGTIECLGRTDRQVKLRGFRIELEEVEAALATHEAVSQAAVVVREDWPGDKRLVAYVVPEGTDQLPPEHLRRHAREHVPEYMVPSVFVTLPDLPLAPNGKVDWSALPVPDPAGQQLERLTPPSDDLERGIASIWAELLHVPNATLDSETSFFDYGGHSLLAVRMLTAVERWHGGRASLASFIQAPTIAELATLLRSMQQANHIPAALPVRTPAKRDTAACTLFLTTAGYGTLMSLRSLAQQLPSETVCWTLQPPGAGDEPWPFNTLKELAAEYVTAMRRIQPEGPYALLGYSIGGLTAFEVAQQLLAQGEEVAFLGLLDTLFPVAMRQQAAVQAALGSLARAGRRTTHRHVMPRKLEQRLLDASAMAQLHAAASYRPCPFPGRLTLFAASSLAAPHAIQVDQWRKLALGGIDEIRVAGRHDSMLRRPHVSDLAHVVQRQLDEALASRRKAVRR